MKKLTASLALICCALGAHAGPFLVGDYYPAPGPQPETCSYTEGTAAPVVAPADKGPDGRARPKFDLAGIPAGDHKIAVSCSLGGWVSPAAPFSFVGGTLPAPSGFSIRSAP